MRTVLYILLVLSLGSGCGAKKEKPKRHYAKERKKPATFGKQFDAIPPSRGFKKPVPPFPYFEGNTFVPSFKVGEKVWGPVPVAGAWDIVNYSISSVTKIKGSGVWLKANGTDFMVPGAMLHKVARPKKRLHPGAPVLCALSMSSEWGKVLKTTKGRVLVGMVWGKEEQKEEVAVENLLLLEDGKPNPGTPVVFQRGRSWEFGQLIHRNRSTSWIIGYAGKLIITKNHQVKLVALTVTHKVKHRVWSLWYDTLEEARIKKVIMGGAGYIISFPDRPPEKYRNPRVVSFARIVKPLG